MDTSERISAIDGATLWLLTFAVSAVIGTHGIAYWDAGDYTLLAITGGKSGLLLGRPLFLWISRLILSTGIDPAYAEPVLRWFWSAIGATAAPALAVLATRLGLERRVGLMAGVALAVSPSFAHTSHQVLTDAPALALSIAGLASAASRHVLRAGVLLAAAIATRETAAVHLVAAILLLGPRRGAICVVACVAALAGVVAIHQPPGIGEWFTAMSRSASAHSWSPLDLLISLAWVLAAGPLPVAIGVSALIRRNVSARVAAVAVPATIATALLMFYPDGSFSPRYVLATAPIAFFIAAAPWLFERRMVATFAMVIVLAAAAVPASRANIVAARGATLNTRIPQLPMGAVVVPGHFCPQARLAAAIARRPDLQFVCPGWDWPADVRSRLDEALRLGAPVAADIADEAWVGNREIGPRDAVREWLVSRQTSDLAGFRLSGR